MKANSTRSDRNASRRTRRGSAVMEMALVGSLLLGQLAAITDRNGYATQLSYNGSGQLAGVTDPAGRTLTVTFGANGYVSQVADPLGQATNYLYDSNGNLTSVTDAMSRATLFGYAGSPHVITLAGSGSGPPRTRC